MHSQDLTHIQRRTWNLNRHQNIRNQLFCLWNVDSLAVRTLQLEYLWCKSTRRHISYSENPLGVFDILSLQMKLEWHCFDTLCPSYSFASILHPFCIHVASVLHRCGGPCGYTVMWSRALLPCAQGSGAVHVEPWANDMGWHAVRWHSGEKIWARHSKTLFICFHEHGRFVDLCRSLWIFAEVCGCLWIVVVLCLKFLDLLPAHQCQDPLLFRFLSWHIS